jgi:hypothetical protein
MKLLIIIFSLMNLFAFNGKQNTKTTFNLIGKWEGKISEINEDISRGKNFAIIFKSVSGSSVNGKIKYDDLVFLDGGDSFTGFFKKPNELTFKINIKEHEDEEINGIFYFAGEHELRISNNTISGIVRNKKDEIIAKFKLKKSED